MLLVKVSAGVFLDDFFMADSVFAPVGLQYAFSLIAAHIREPASEV